MEIVAASPKRRTDTDEEAEARMKRCAAFHSLLLDCSRLGPPVPDGAPPLVQCCVQLYSIPSLPSLRALTPVIEARGRRLASPDDQPAVDPSRPLPASRSTLIRCAFWCSATLSCPPRITIVRPFSVARAGSRPR